MTGSPVLNAEQVARILEQSFASARGTTTEQLTALEGSLREALVETNRRMDDLPEDIKADVKEYLATLEAAYRKAFSKWVSWREDFQRSAEAHFKEFQKELADLLTEQQRLAAGVHDDGLAFGEDIEALRKSLDTRLVENRQYLDVLSLNVDSNGRGIKEITGKIEALVEEHSVLATSSSQILKDLDAGLEACEARDAKTDDEVASLDADFRDAMKEWEDFATRVADLQTTNEERFDDFHEHRQRVTAHIESFARIESFAPVEKLQAMQERLLELMLQVDANKGEAHTDIANRFEAAADGFLGLQQRIERRIEDIAVTLAKSIATVRDWQSDGPPYWANSVVRHRGGIWIAARETTGAPGSSPDWNLLFEGVDQVDMGTDPKDGTRLSLSLRTSSGFETGFDMDLPSFAFHGTWSMGKTYKARDTVMHDGHRWVALRDSPEGQPSESEHWRLFAMRGPRGRKGDRGPPGETPSTKDFILAWRAHLDVADGTPVMRFRGAWSFEKSFMAGDVVSYEKSLYIAVTDREASFDPPTVTQDSGWAMFAPYRTVGAGAAVREVEGQTGF